MSLRRAFTWLRTGSRPYYSAYLMRLAFRRGPWIAAGAILTLTLTLTLRGGRAKPMPEKWEFRLLGGLTARRGDTVVTKWRSVRVRSLVGYLALHHKGSHDRGYLAQEIWGEESPAQRPADRDKASALLTQELSRLRKQLCASDGTNDLIVSDAATIGFDGDVIETDVDRFHEELGRAARASSRTEKVAHLEEAARIYRDGGEFLSGVNHEWVITQRQLLAAQYDATKDELASLRTPSDGEQNLAAMKQRLGSESARYHERVAAAAREALDTPEQKRWLERLDAERQSCLAAIEWEIQQDRVPKLVGSQVLRFVWQYHGRREVADWLTRRLHSPGFVAPTPKPWVLSTAGHLNFLDGRIATGRQMMKQALALFQRMGRRGEIAGSLTSLGWMAQCDGDIPSGIRYAQFAENEYVAIGLDREAVHCRLVRARLLSLEGRHKDARQLAEDAARAFARLNDRANEAHSLMCAALSAARAGDADASEALTVRCETLAGILKSLSLDCEIAMMRAESAMIHRDYAHAAQRFVTCMRISERAGDSFGIVGDITGFLAALDGLMKTGDPASDLSPSQMFSLATLISAVRRFAHTNTILAPNVEHQAHLEDLDARLGRILGKGRMRDAARVSTSLTPEAAMKLAVEFGPSA